MSAIFSSITQTPYYALSLKTAIFDGALRLYFAPEQESEAFKIYAQLKNLIHNPGLSSSADDSYTATVYIMMYPDEITKNECFGGVSSTTHTTDSVQKVSIGKDLILGLNGHDADSALDELSQVTRNFLTQNLAAPGTADMASVCPA